MVASFLRYLVTPLLSAHFSRDFICRSSLKTFFKVNSPQWGFSLASARFLQPSQCTITLNPGFCLQIFKPPNLSLLPIPNCRSSSRGSGNLRKDLFLPPPPFWVSIEWEKKYLVKTLPPRFLLCVLSFPICLWFWLLGALPMLPHNPGTGLLWKGTWPQNKRQVPCFPTKEVFLSHWVWFQSVALSGPPAWLNPKIVFNFFLQHHPVFCHRKGVYVHLLWC